MKKYKYPEEFKIFIVNLYKKGRKKCELSREYQLNPSTLNNWIKQDQNKLLEKENEYLKKKIEFLKQEVITMYEINYF